MSPRLPTIELIGVYEVEGEPDCCLIELVVHDAQGRFGFVEFTQPIAGKPAANWQCPWLECLLDGSGENIIADDLALLSLSNDRWQGDLRFAFYFHCLDLSQPLVTPFGEIWPTQPTHLPPRLQFMNYAPPD